MPMGIVARHLPIRGCQQRRLHRPGMGCCEMLWQLARSCLAAQKRSCNQTARNLVTGHLTRNRTHAFPVHGPGTLRPVAQCGGGGAAHRGPGRAAAGQGPRQHLALAVGLAGAFGTAWALRSSLPLLLRGMGEPCRMQMQAALVGAAAPRGRPEVGRVSPPTPTPLGRLRLLGAGRGGTPRAGAAARSGRGRASAALSVLRLWGAGEEVPGRGLARGLGGAPRRLGGGRRRGTEV